MVQFRWILQNVISFEIFFGPANHAEVIITYLQVRLGQGVLGCHFGPLPHSHPIPVTLMTPCGFLCSSPLSVFVPLRAIMTSKSTSDFTPLVLGSVISNTKLYSSINDDTGLRPKRPFQYLKMELPFITMIVVSISTIQSHS